MFKPTQKILPILKWLKKQYPDHKTALNYSSPYHLVMATILSAQCTDKRVNMITPALFKKYPTPESVLNSPPGELEEMIHSTGFYKNKAKNIRGMSKALIDNFNGIVPGTMKELVTLPGVGRKTANVILGDIFGIQEGVTVDTHVIRITQLLGLTKNKDAIRIERDLMKLIPQKDWTNFSHTVIYHGRSVCIARRPKCELCGLKKWCNYYSKSI